MARSCTTGRVGRTISIWRWTHAAALARALPWNSRTRACLERWTVWKSALLNWNKWRARPLAKKNPPVTTELQNGAAVSNDDRDECVANLLVEGQKLIETHAVEKALECFDMALAIQPQHAETLVKKAGALEKLDRVDEAIACYDRAIEADDSLAIAYLQKGGLFNRLARYNEALQCYEQALRTQEKKSSREKVAA